MLSFYGLTRHTNSALYGNRPTSNTALVANGFRLSYTCSQINVEAALLLLLLIAGVLALRATRLDAQ